MQVDIIIVSYAKDDYCTTLTQQSIDTCHNSEPDIDFNIVTIEQNKEVKHKNCKTYHYDFEFNYNKCLNYGISLTNNDYICLCNNDLEFEKEWANNLITGMEFMECQTGSPFSRYTIHKQLHKVENAAYKSFKVGQEFLGWCIMCKREVFSKYKLPEFTKFWYSDNLFALQLQKLGYNHCLVCNSVVNHVNKCSNTLNRMESKIQQDYTNKEYNSYLGGIKYINSKY